MHEYGPYGELIEGIKSSINNALDKAGYGEFDEDIAKSIDTSKMFGDISSSVVLRIAKAKSLNAVELAEGIVKLITKPKYVEEVFQKNGFLNFTIERNAYSIDVVKFAINEEKIFSSKAWSGKKAIIEYPSINPAHPMHMGQVRNVLLGDGIANLYERAGYKVEREDYIDDLGLQVAEVIWGLSHMEKIGITFDSNKKFDRMIGEVYVAVNKQLEDKNVKDEISQILVNMEQDGTYESKTAREMAESFVKAEYETLAEMEIYHDVLVWESDIVRKRLLDEALEKMNGAGIITKPTDGEYANCVVIEHSKLGNLASDFGGLKEGVKVLIRSNGAPNYVAKDIAFHMWKLGLLPNSFLYHEFMEQGSEKRLLYSTGSDGSQMEFGAADVAINTIDARQSYEQAVVRLVIALLGGNEYSEKIKHIAYGVVELEGTSLSGRKGTWVGYTCDDLIREAKEKASKLITDRFELNEGEKAEVARQIAMSAIKYEFLKLSNEKNLVFSWSRALNFEGNSGPYCEYTHARAERILESPEAEGKKAILENYKISQQEFDLIKRISYARTILEKSVKECKPNIVIEYMTMLASEFSKFYETIPILKAQDEVDRSARLAITKAFEKLMSELLLSLGMTPVKRM
ncbi:MAG: arginine--tRNA ligase [Methanothrix sp.]